MSNNISILSHKSLHKNNRIIIMLLLVKVAYPVATFGFAIYIVNMRVTCPLLFRVDAPLFGNIAWPHPASSDHVLLLEIPLTISSSIESCCGEISRCKGTR